jgi:hypothetical protein
MSVETKSQEEFIEGLHKINVTKNFSYTPSKPYISASHKKLVEFVEYLKSYGFKNMDDTNEYSESLKSSFGDEQFEILKILIHKMSQIELFNYRLTEAEHNAVKDMYPRGGGKYKSKTYKRKLRNILTNHKSRKYKRKN